MRVLNLHSVVPPPFLFPYPYQSLPSIIPSHQILFHNSNKSRLVLKTPDYVWSGSNILSLGSSNVWRGPLPSSRVSSENIKKPSSKKITGGFFHILQYGDGGSRTHVQRLCYFSVYACRLTTFGSHSIMPSIKASCVLSWESLLTASGGRCQRSSLISEPDAST